MQIAAMEASNRHLPTSRRMCGNLDVPGGNVLVRYAYNSFQEVRRRASSSSLPEMLDRRIGTDQSPIHKAGYTPFIPPDLLLEAMETGVPYPSPADLGRCSTNPIANMAGDAPRVYKRVEERARTRSWPTTI